MRKALLLCCGLICLINIHTTNASPRPRAVYKHFTKQTGFVGSCTTSNDGRIFSKLKGKFNLPEPKDSLILQSNTDKIANILMSIYKKQGANYNLKRMSYDDSTHACQYIQYWKNFYLEHQPYYLLITYHPKSNTYSIYNNLYMKPITIPDKVINLVTAEHVLDFAIRTYSPGTDLTELPKDYASTDTLKTFYVKLNEFGDRESRTLLNLYPTSGESESPSFSLQWRFHEPYSRGSDYLIEAQTGSLMGSALQNWQDKSILLKAANRFISDNNLTGKCTYISNADGSIAFCGIKEPVVIRDTKSYKQLADKYVDAILRMYHQLDNSIAVDYQGIKTNGNKAEMYYYATYIQKFRYPMVYTDHEMYRILITMNIISGKLDIEADLLTLPGGYPGSIISPEAIIRIAELKSKYARNSNVFSNACERVVKHKVNTKTIPYENSYWNSKAKMKARLQIMPIYDSYTGSVKGNSLVWAVTDNYENNYGTYGIYNPVTGVPYYSLNPDFIYAFKGYAPPAPFEPFYQGFYVNIPFLGMLSDRYFVGGENPNKIQYCINSLTEIIANPLTYGVPYYLKLFNYTLPECVISPQTALAICKHDANLPFVWTELANMSGTRDYAPESVGFWGNPDKGLRLELYPFKVKNTANKYTYKLIWKYDYSEGNPDKIDAVTGEILKDENEGFHRVLI